MSSSLPIFGLRWDDVDFVNRRVRLFTCKRTSGREGDWIPLTGQLSAALQEQRRETGGRQRVFINPKTDRPYTSGSKMMRKMCERAAVRPFGFHAIRHLSASMLAKAGIDLPTIQLILRHQSITTTSRYVHSLVSATDALDRTFGSLLPDTKKASSK